MTDAERLAAIVRLDIEIAVLKGELADEALLSDADLFKWERLFEWMMGAR